MSSDRLDKISAHIDANQETYVSRLGEAVAIKSVSGDPQYREETIRMVKEYGKNELERLGATVTLRDLGNEPGTDPPLPLPPVILAQLGNDPKKKTVCIYGHLDVQPAHKSDGWNTEPFDLTEIDGKMYGRGSTDDKGPVLAWFNVIEAYQALKLELPINIKFCFEGMEESGSVGLEELVLSEKDEFFKNVDFTCISDNYWLGQKTPCITYGLRGISYFQIHVKCAKQDLHSGVHGGVVHEAMTDLCHIFNSLVSSDGKIKIDHIYDDVLPLTEEEEATYGPIDFDTEIYKEELGVTRLAHDSKAKVLQHRWRFPSCSIHGVEGAFYGAGAKTVIPHNVIGKFSIRLVPKMDPAKVEKLVKEYIAKVHAETGSPNIVTVSSLHGAPAWVGDFNDANFTAGRNAIKRVFNQDADLTREGGSIPITLTFEEATGKSVMLLPIGASDDAAHSQNEKLNRSNFLNGMKVLAAYFEELGKQ